MEWMQTPVALLLVGALAGLASGLFGIGGGLILLPIFTVLMRMDPHKAAATSLAILMLPIALPAVWNYQKAGEINWWMAVWIALGFVLSNVFGSKINLAMDDQLLRRVFAVFLVLAAINMAMKPSKKAAAAKDPAGVATTDTVRR